MKRHHFPVIALTLAIPLLGLLWIGGQPTGAELGAPPWLPVLMLLMVSELGLLLCLGGVVLGVQQGRRQGWTSRSLIITLGCALAALAFLLQLARWWPL
jgi:hypothetical protein